eukprot:1915257-Heterocapsa_arctica.AAC.1
MPATHYFDDFLVVDAAPLRGQLHANSRRRHEAPRLDREAAQAWSACAPLRAGLRCAGRRHRPL